MSAGRCSATRVTRWMWFVGVVALVLGLGSFVSPTGAAAVEPAGSAVSAGEVSVGSVAESVDAVFTSSPTDPMSSKDNVDGSSNLGVPGGITGRVIGDDGIGVADAAVAIQGLDSRLATTVFTDGGGLFGVSELASGTYVVRVAVEADRMGGQAAQTVTVTSGDVTDVVLRVHQPANSRHDDDAALGRDGGDVAGGVAALAQADAALVDDGSIAGTVTDEAASPIAGVEVTACQFGSGTCGGALTGMDGSYQINGLPPGDYQVLFDPPSPYAPEYFDDANYGLPATPVAVSSGAVTSGIDALLGLSGSIAGTVTDETSLPITGVHVQACVLGGTFFCQSAWTGVDGSYQIDGLPPVDYRVQFDPPVPYALEYFDDANYGFSATPVSVSLGAVTSGIDALLGLSGSIAGMVTDSGGAGLAGVIVDLYESGSNEYWGFRSTLPDGSYQIDGLPPGDYMVAFVSPFGSPYASEFFDDAPNFGAATPVTVSAGAVTFGIDAVLEFGNSIAGTVADEASSPIAGVNVFACPMPAGICGSALTAGDGSYQIDGLAVGVYLVNFDPPAPYAPEYFDDARSYLSATPVTVSAGAVTSGIDAVLGLGGSIVGTVTDEASSPIAGVNVTSCPSVGGFCGSALTGTDGFYEIDGLQPGDYSLGFVPPSPYAWEYFENAPNSGSATPVTVSAGAVTSGINAVLGLGGSIAGIVTDSGGAGIAGVNINVFVAGSGQYQGGGLTLPDGSYQIGGLPPGDYVVAFVGPFGSPYTSEFFDDSPTFDLATPVTVSADAVTSGIGAVLELAGSIAGIVTDEASSPIEGVYVEACPVQFGFCGSALTAADGSYQIDGLSPRDGGYQVSFEGQDPLQQVSPPSPYAPEYFDDVVERGLGDTGVGGCWRGDVGDRRGVGVGWFGYRHRHRRGVLAYRRRQRDSVSSRRVVLWVRAYGG